MAALDADSVLCIVISPRGNTHRLPLVEALVLVVDEGWKIAPDAVQTSGYINYKIAKREEEIAYIRAVAVAKAATDAAKIAKCEEEIADLRAVAVTKAASIVSDAFAGTVGVRRAATDAAAVESARDRRATIEADIVRLTRAVDAAAAKKARSAAAKKARSVKTSNVNGETVVHR
jgi:hypothetical protein